MKTQLLVLTLGLGLGACKFTEFDDLSDQAWVHSTTKPDVKSSDYGLAMTSAQHAGDGGNLFVLGTDPPTLSTLEYDASGSTSLGAGAIDLNVQAAVSSIPAQPLVLDDPDTDNVTVVVPTLEGRVIVEGGDPNAPAQLAIVDDPATADTPLAATLATNAGGTQSIVVAGIGKDNVNNLHVITPPSTDDVKCTAFDTDGATLLNSIAMVTAPAVGANGTIFALTTDGRIVGYDAGVVLNTDAASAAPGCYPQQTLTTNGTEIDLAFPKPVQGEISLITDTIAIVAGHGDPTKDDKGFVTVVDLAAGTVIGTPLSADGLRGFAFGTLADGNTYVALGFPNRSVDSVVSGEVEVHAVDATSASPIDSTIALLLNDAQPDANEKFGRALAITSFNDEPILVVGASNEVFSYYRTLLYDDTRK
jgi:hypothetical protein